MFSVVIIPYPFIVTLVSRWQYYLFTTRRQGQWQVPHGAPRARSWQRPPSYAVGCEGAYGVRIDAVRLLSESLLVETVASGCVFPFIRATHLEPPAEPRSEGRHGAVAACESRRAQHRLGLPEEGKRARVRVQTKKSLAASSSSTYQMVTSRSNFVSWMVSMVYVRLDRYTTLSGPCFFR